MEKNTGIIAIILGLAVLGIVYYFKIKGKPDLSNGVRPDDLSTTDNKSNFIPPSEDKLREDFKALNLIYGPAIAKNIERIYRYETAHFTSGQYKATGSAGMLKFVENYPYGWSVAKNMWDEKPALRPNGSVDFTKNGKKYTYLVFPTFMAAAVALGEYLKKYRPGRWNTTDPIGQTNYENKISQITTKFT